MLTVSYKIFNIKLFVYLSESQKMWNSGRENSLFHLVWSSNKVLVLHPVHALYKTSPNLNTMLPKSVSLEIEYVNGKW